MIYYKDFSWLINVHGERGQKTIDMGISMEYVFQINKSIVRFFTEMICLFFFCFCSKFISIRQLFGVDFLYYCDIEKMHLLMV